MAHMIDTTTGRAAIAYAGETPWHKLGQRMEAGMSMDEWQRAAGLGYEVHRAPVQYVNGDTHVFKGRNVLYRGDTGGALSIVSDNYHEVQPREVLDFFRQITEIGGFEMESAGALADGKRIWALAKVSEGAEVVAHDVVKPYLLLATSYDGTMATTAKFTTVRVVCQNTLTMSEGDVDHMVRVLHRDRFNAESVKARLGIVTGQFERFMLQARRLSEKRLDPETVDKLTFDLIAPTVAAPKGQPLPDIRQTRGYKRVVELFKSESIGNEAVGPSAWGWLNAVTQWTDWERGRTPDSRVNSAWFGSGDALKSKAFDMALEA